MIEMPQEKEDLQLNMAPMIDMIFLLIIFFLTATTFTEREREQDVLLPSNRNPGSLSRNMDNNIIINVMQDGAIFVLGEQISAEQLVGMLRQRKAELEKKKVKLTVQIRPDKRVIYGGVAAALEAAERAGIAKPHLISKTVELD
ncbi:MAG: biopolymer transporter ExbD [Planctomycetes bacterium]|nr:biopolymer transporter ExbD [Planctomycetota bacterium]